MASVTKLSSARQPPDQERVDGAEAKFALCRPRPRALDVGKHPGELRTGEIGIEQQAGLSGEDLLQPLALQLGAIGSGAAVLPDDGIVDRLAGIALPNDNGFALVGDSDSGNGFRSRSASFRALRIDHWTLSQIASGSCSTQPEAG